MTTAEREALRTEARAAYFEGRPVWRDNPWHGVVLAHASGLHTHGILRDSGVTGCPICELRF